MKAGWVRKKLCDVTTKIGSGATPIGGEDAYKTSGISLIRSLNVYDDGFRDRKLARIDEEQAARLSNVVVEVGDVLLNITGASVARCCVAPSDFLPARVNQHVSIIRPVKHMLDSKFLHYLLISRSYKERLLHTGEEGGSTRQAITKSQLQNFLIEFPASLSEQQRLVAILDEAFEGIATAKANAEKSLQNASELLNTLTSQAFTQLNEAQVSRALGSVCKFENGDRGKNYPGKEHRVARGVPFINAGHLTPQGVDFSEMDYISPERFSLLGNGKIRPQDVLFCLRGSLGKFASVGSLSCGAIASSLVILRPTHELDHGYLLCFLGSTLCREQIDAYKGGAAQPNLGAKDLKRFELPLPSLEVQRQVANQITECQERVVELMDSINQKLAALGELKESLLRQAFTGQL